MIEKDKIASIIDTLIEDCGECPLERICDTNKCTHVWERFLESKVKEDGVEIEEQRSYEADHTQNYNKALEHDADLIRKQINAGWIPVEEQLPENAKHKGAFCPKYQVETKYGVTEGWYNPDVKSWYCLFWFMTQRYLEHEIDFVKGDVPKVVRVPLESDIVIAWRPLPESYRPERSMK